MRHRYGLRDTVKAESEARRSRRKKGGRVVFSVPEVDRQGLGKLDVCALEKD